VIQVFAIPASWSLINIVCKGQRVMGGMHGVNHEETNPSTRTKEKENQMVYGVSDATSEEKSNPTPMPMPIPRCPPFDAISGWKGA
jgi:hypothetical protein